MQSNPQLELADNFVRYTDRNIFLTGKAGTGKTTFLHNLKTRSVKRMAIIAPTGVAAINAGGVTIHSFFQLPFGPYISRQLGGASGQDPQQRYQKFNREKVNLIRSLDLLVIDEISMVRADTLDGIDDVLRRYKDRDKPFGGVQLLMIGDLHQLAPVVKEEDWKILRDFYPNLYFFSSLALGKTPVINIELKHIYRQSDTAFIDLLNTIRENRITPQVLEMLNGRYVPGFKPADDDGYITLTTHNHTAHEINHTRLEELPAEPLLFTASLKGDFPEYAYPTIEKLVLKKGAQVMFVKNDPSREKLFYNGKIGQVIDFEGDTIFVKCPGDPGHLAVTPAEWKNITYKLNEAKEVEESVAGTFTQYPLKLAWAITIHKSQGLTFEKAIIDAGASFAHGQVYVALSRCKSFEGLVLRSPISLNSVKTDGTIATYTRYTEENAPGESELQASRIKFQQNLLYEIFDFTAVRTRFFHLQKVAQDHDHSIAGPFIDVLNQVKIFAEKDIYTVADNFQKQLAQLLNTNTLPEENDQAQERIKKAASWFAQKIAQEMLAPAENLSVESDNKDVKKTVGDALENFRMEVFVKLAAVKECINGFNTIACLKIKANAAIDFQQQKTAAPKKKLVLAANIPHPALYQSLKEWRDRVAGGTNVPVYIVLPQKSIMELVQLLPSSLPQLETVKGIGKKKLEQYGEELLTIIISYCIENRIEQAPSQAVITPVKEPKVKPDTRKASFDLFNAGKGITEIAAARNLAPGTIERHLSYYVRTGELDIFKLVPREKVEQVKIRLKNELSPVSLSGLKNAMGDDYSFGELRMILEFLEPAIPESG
ncbi:HRDC domain-containing protein [Hufsiella ginkgonis]|uniref:AAA family ATPase n=1 Tax=Hufsiella ginkgonis TaxID=2695274 RepID=A0A7K1Y247_9SPHI|nr:HRDC domain-containing protein [Hufsiella ginkgonis]MXV17315.1 AAA family ATPase [Hufsiella ginkgonis]